MHYFVTFIMVFTSANLFGVEKSAEKSSDLEIKFTHTILFEKAASDLRVRQLQKLVAEDNWARKTAEVNGSSQKR